MRNNYPADMAVDFIKDLEGFMYETAMNDGPSCIGDVFVIHLNNGYSELRVNIHDLLDDSTFVITCELNMFTEYLVRNTIKINYKRIVGQDLVITRLVEDK